MSIPKELLLVLVLVDGIERDITTTEWALRREDLLVLTGNTWEVEVADGSLIMDKTSGVLEPQMLIKSGKKTIFSETNIGRESQEN